MADKNEKRSPSVVEFDGPGEDGEADVA